MSNEDKMREEFERWLPKTELYGQARMRVDKFNQHEKEIALSSWKACAAIKDAEIASRDAVIKELREALLPFAENIPEDYKAPCHNGLTTARKCGRCGKAYRAYEALANSAHHNSKVLEKMLLEARIEVLNQAKFGQSVSAMLQIEVAKLAELNKEQ